MFYEMHSTRALFDLKETLIGKKHWRQTTFAYLQENTFEICTARTPNLSPLNPY